MNDRGIVDELALHAYIDGELSDSDRVAIEDALRHDPALAERVVQYRADKARLSEVYGRVREEPLPVKWLETIASSSRKPRSPFQARAFAAIAAALLVVIGGLALNQRSVPHQESIIEEAIAARNEAIPAHQILSFTTAAHSSAPDRIVASALAMRVRVPDLSRLGYALTGVRIYDNAPGGKSVELLYRKANMTLFALYLRHPSGPARFDQFKQGRLRVCIWQDEVLGTVMTGEMSAAEMQRLASLAYTGLES